MKKAKILFLLFMLKLFHKLRLISERDYFDYWFILKCLEHDLKIVVVKLD